MYLEVLLLYKCENSLLHTSQLFHFFTLDLDFFFFLHYFLFAADLEAEIAQEESDSCGV